MTSVAAAVATAATMSSNETFLASPHSLPYLPYEEPAVTTLLILAGFIIVLNCVSALLDRLLYCGLVGQILIGTAWGAPGANWLSLDTQKTIVQLGYLGLILLVYEGGLSTSLSSIKQNIWLSLCVAAVGICTPIALSFLLILLSDASPLQSFAAGAALSSTSLGTTFTLLSSCGLISTRLGTVLTTAAMIDDVVGLIMVQVVSNLGAESNGTPLSPTTVLRPIGVSTALVLSLAILCRFIAACSHRLVPAVRMLLRVPMLAFLAQSLFLLGIFAGASYAGTSGLFAAYLVGAVLTWWDKDFQPGAIDFLLGGGVNAVLKSGANVYESRYASVTNMLLKPLFFASIGFAIPIGQLFRASVVWRGIVYALLMLIAKAATGIWLLRQTTTTASCFRRQTVSTRNTDRSWPSVEVSPSSLVRHSGEGLAGVSYATAPEVGNGASSAWYPVSLLGLAMTARGEIGYLIASVAESSGVFASGADDSGESEVFLVVIWAVTLCTILGPLSVGLLVRHMRNQGEHVSGLDGVMLKLGQWGAQAE